MSLDLANRNGRAHNVAPFVAADFSGVVAATFDSGDLAKAGKLLLQVDLTANGMDLNTLPTTLLDANGAELLEDGLKLTVVKVDVTGNNLTFLDPVTGVSYDYVNRRGESISLVADWSTGAAQWVAEI